MGKGRDGLKSIIDDRMESLSVINDRLKSIVTKTISHDKELSNIIESQGYSEKNIVGNYPSAEDDNIVESFGPGRIMESELEDGYTDVQDELDAKIEAMLEEKEDFDYEIVEMSFEPETNDELDDEIVEMLTTKTEEYYEHQEDLLEQFNEFMDNEENIIEAKLTEEEKAANFQKKQERRGTRLGSDGNAGAIIGRMTDSYKRSFQYNKRFLRKIAREIRGLKGEVSKVFLNSLAENQSLIFHDMGAVLNAFEAATADKNPAKKIQKMIRGYMAEAEKMAKSVTGVKLGKETLGELAFELITEIENGKSSSDRTKIAEKDLRSAFKLLKAGGVKAMENKEEEDARTDKTELGAYKGSLKTGDDILEGFSSETTELKSLMMNIIESIDTMSEEELEDILEMKRYNKNNIVNPKDGYVDKRPTDARTESVKKRQNEDFVTGFVNDDRLGKGDSEKERGLKITLRKLMENYGAKTIARIAGGMQSGAYGMGFFVDMQRIAFKHGEKLKKSFKGNAISQIESIRQGRTIAAFVTNFMTWLRRLNKAGLFTGGQFKVQRKNEAGKVQEKAYVFPKSSEMQKVIKNLKEEVIQFLHTTARNEFWSGWRKNSSRTKKAAKAAGRKVKQQDIFEDIALVTSML